MSGDACWNKNVFSRWRTVEIDDDDWTWTSNVFQTIAAVQQETSDVMCH